jgi:hypothetical protein
LPLPRSDCRNTSNNVALERLASAAETKNEVGKRMALAVETKNGIAKEQLMIQLFLANPQSVASIAFFAPKSRAYPADVTTTNNVPVNFDDCVKLEPEFGQLPDTQKLVGCLLDAAAAAASHDDEDNKDVYEDKADDDDEVHNETYFYACKWLENKTPPVIDLTLLRRYEFSDGDDDEKENEAPVPLAIKVQVEAATEERSGLHSTPSAYYCLVLIHNLVEPRR